MWFKKKNSNKSDISLVKSEKCMDCENMFIPFDILVTKEGKYLCNNCFIKDEEK